MLYPLMATSLRRGEEMWPPTNVENPAQLKDSFPLGYVVPVPPQQEDSSSYNKGKRNRIKRILRKAARFQIQKTSSSIDFSPFFLSTVLLFMGYVTPMDRLFVLAFSAYVTCLYQWAQQPILETNEHDRVVMPSLPPQGHVPFLWINPLGLTITNSTLYQIWIQIGAVIGFLAPLTCMAWNLLSRFIRKVNYFSPSSMRLCGSPLFLLGCQVFSEAVAKRFMAPLPLRILIPVAYNTYRLGSIWQWASCFQGEYNVERTLAWANFLYWNIHLFLFLLPIATLRYMRAHFFCVEASEVSIRYEDGLF